MKDLLSKYKHLCTTDVLPLLWIPPTYIDEGTYTNWVTAGHKIRVEDGKLVNVAEGKPANKKITRCYNTVLTDFQLEVVDLETNELSFVTI